MTDRTQAALWAERNFPRAAGRRDPRPAPSVGAAVAARAVVVATAVVRAVAAGPVVVGLGVVGAVATRPVVVRVRVVGAATEEDEPGPELADGPWFGLAQEPWWARSW